MEKVYRKVSVKERLPKRKGITFCFEKVNHVYDAPTAYYFSPDIGGFFNDSSDKEITHWLEEIDIEDLAKFIKKH